MKRKKRSDRRTQRTRVQLSFALNELIKEKPFDNITVQSVIDRANVGRATFYSHFDGKEDLFEQQWEEGMKNLAEQIDWDRAGKDSFFPTESFFQHLLEVQPFYRGLERSGKIDSIFKNGVGYLSHHIESSLIGRIKLVRTQDQRLRLVAPRLEVKPTPVIPIPILANYLASEFFALLKWWLDAGMPYPPKSMDKIFHRLVNPSIKSAFSSGMPGS